MNANTATAPGTPTAWATRIGPSAVRHRREHDPRAIGETAITTRMAPTSNHEHLTTNRIGIPNNLRTDTDTQAVAHLAPTTDEWWQVPRLSQLEPRQRQSLPHSRSECP